MSDRRSWLLVERDENGAARPGVRQNAVAVQVRSGRIFVSTPSGPAGFGPADVARLRQVLADAVVAAIEDRGGW